jgi:proteasome lid subunit RPN8/RPN11
MLILLNQHIKQIIDYCENNPLIEVCGILVGNDSQVKKVLFIANQYDSPTRFFMEPTELLHAFTWMDEQKMELLGIFHSHPNGPETPSMTDIKEFNYPGVESVIATPRKGIWELFPYIIEGQKFKRSKIISC